ncbi:MAG: peptidoglycan recognition protein family protein, partial [Bacillota bacterium]
KYMNFYNLPQLVDRIGKLKSKGIYSMRTKTITHRVWHHSLTKKNLGGYDAERFADHHVNTLGWPGGEYTFIIEPKNLINTPNGKRARIVYANDIDRRTYHVGNSNQFSLGICVAGDYRYDTMDDATLASIAELQAAFVKAVSQAQQQLQQMTGGQQQSGQQMGNQQGQQQSGQQMGNQQGQQQSGQQMGNQQGQQQSGQQMGNQQGQQQFSQMGQQNQIQ